MNPHVSNNEPKLVGDIGNYAFFHPLLGSLMTGNEHDMLTMFFKLKPPIILGTKIEDVLKFIVDCCERLHKFGIIHRHEVESVSFQFQGEANQWWRDYMECRAITLPPLTWTKFHVLFSEKYVLRTLRDRKKNDFVTLQ